MSREAVRIAASGYSNLEFDLETGERGSRTSLVEELLCSLTGAEALGLEDTLGSFEEGKRPGIVQLTGVDLQHRRLTPEATTRRIL